MKIGLVHEGHGETLVALTPDSVQRLVSKGHTITVEAGAGNAAGFNDQQYCDAGATIQEERKALVVESDVIATVTGPREAAEWGELSPGTVVVGMLKPFSAPVRLYEHWAEAGVTALSMDALPRISRAQSMDVLSSLSTVMGYRAAIIAAERVRKFFPLLMTAAGTIPPARVLILGAGVAGLQAIATAHRLGARVEAFDTRPEVREQVESLGATFLTLDVESQATQDGYATELADDAHKKENERLREPVARADAIITTAQIPGQRAPILITREMLSGMRPGSVIIDLAAETGGNTEVTKVGESVFYAGVEVVGSRNLASELPHDASQLFGRNLANFLQYLEDAGITWNAQHEVSLPDDEIVNRTMLIHEGRLLHAGLLKRQGGGVLDVTHR
ncbi:Re/Si-specific NAD(P)(+) transhydrogenase subunit alpha [Sulfobacillus harzensis]|uniref:Re/Si-specific NAD(P)(+) transhydrogenase subunit alpha n=1 Tax=Sulfobacillus harzensis TaxID=2729629 RepID=UPI0030841A34